MSDSSPLPARRDPPRRILLIRPSSLGDVVRTAPAAASLRHAFPDATIDWVVAEPFIPAVKHHPAINRIIPFPRAAIGNHLRRLQLKPIREWLATLMASDDGHPYDLAIDLQGLFRSGLMARATHAPRKVGFADAREGGWLFYNERIRVARGLSHIDRDVELLRAINVPPSSDDQGRSPDLRLYPGDEARDFAHSDDRLKAKRFIVLAPTTRGAGRAWPMDRYAELARRLLSAHAHHLVLVGAANERLACAPLLHAARHDKRVIDLVGATDILKWMAVIERADLVVCNDSAAMHVAAAFHRPMVALMGPTRPERSGPYRRPHDAISKLKHNEHVRHRDAARAADIMRRITVDEVVQTCAERLEQQRTT
ncbi:MAG: glycosyltransferase family 9 protein [Phycisphaerales bacterium]